MFVTLGQHAQRPQAPPAFPRSPETPADAPVAQPAQVSGIILWKTWNNLRLVIYWKLYKEFRFTLESQPKKGKGKKGGKGGAEGKPVATETSTTSTAAPAPGDLTVPASNKNNYSK